MSTPPWLSILIPMYNVRDFLSACIDSVMAQWEPGIEVVLLDDASTDDTLAVAQAACQRHTGRLQLVQHGHNRGISAARNTLLQHAQGTYVWFLDSDDWLMPGAVLSLHACVNRYHPDLVMCDYRQFREGGSLRRRLKDRLRVSTFTGPSRRVETDREKLMLHLIRAEQFHAWSKIARRESWAQAPFPEGRTIEDMAVIPALVAACDRWIHLPEAWVGYRIRANSLVRTRTASMQTDLVRAVFELHSAVMNWPGYQTRGALHRTLNRFSLHYIGTVAAWSHGQDKDHNTLPLDVHAVLRELFPQGVGQALGQVQGWSWRHSVGRLRKRYARVGWLT
jgi:glycosyltransferase involved in cell wall biosynthesis